MTACTYAGQPEPWYIALAFDQFAAQVMASWVPELRDRPFAVLRQSVSSHKTLVWACSPAARAMGIAAGMPFPALQKQFPGVLAVPQNAELEQTARAEILRILETYAPAPHMGNTGTALVNITGTPLVRTLKPQEIAENICRDIRDRVGMQEIAAGVSRSSLVAQVLATHAVPRGVRVAAAGREEEALAPLDARLLPGLSQHCRQRLRDYALHTMGDIQRLHRGFLESRFGAEGGLLYGMVRGVPGTEASAGARERVQAETILPTDVNDVAELQNLVRFTADRLCHALRNRELCVDRLTCAILYSDNTRAQKTVRCAAVTGDFADIARLGLRLFAQVYGRRVAVRSITLSVSHPRKDTGQLCLFDTGGEHRQRALAAGICRIRNRMGFTTIVNASSMGAHI